MFSAEKFKERVGSSEDRLVILEDLQSIIPTLDLEESVAKGIEEDLIIQRSINEVNKAYYLAGEITREEQQKNFTKTSRYLLSVIAKISDSPNISDAQKRKEIYSTNSLMINEMPLEKYIAQWRELIAWFQKNRVFLVDEQVATIPVKDEEERMAFRGEILQMVNYLQAYWEEGVLEPPFEQWFYKQLSKANFTTVNLELLQFGLTNLVEIELENPISEFRKVHINEYLDVCVYVLEDYSNSKSG